MPLLFRSILLSLVLGASACEQSAPEPSPSAAGSASAGSLAEPPTSVAQTPAASPLPSAPAPSASEPNAIPTATPTEASPLRTRRPPFSRGDLDAFNRWATRAALRDDLPALVAHGLPLASDAKTTIEIAPERGESPRETTVTVIQEGLLDDSIRAERFVLRLSRKPCDSCASGLSGWWLYKIDVTRRCWPGRGHEGFSEELCR